MNWNGDYEKPTEWIQIDFLKQNRNASQDENISFGSKYERGDHYAVSSTRLRDGLDTNLQVLQVLQVLQQFALPWEGVRH